MYRSLLWTADRTTKAFVGTSRARFLAHHANTYRRCRSSTLPTRGASCPELRERREKASGPAGPRERFRRTRRSCWTTSSRGRSACYSSVTRSFLVWAAPQQKPRGATARWPVDYYGRLRRRGRMAGIGRDGLRRQRHKTQPPADRSRLRRVRLVGLTHFKQLARGEFWRTPGRLEGIWRRWWTR